MERIKKVYVAVGMLVVILMLGSALSHGAAPKAQGSAMNSGRALKIAVRQDLPNFNYFDVKSNTVWKSNVIGWNFESLIGMDFDGKPYGLLAKSWDFNPYPYPSVTLYLREGITWQDGQPFTAKDVIFSYCALRGNTTVSGQTFTIPFDDNNDGFVSFSEIQNHVIYVNEYTVKITARQPYNNFFLGTLNIPIIPMHIWKDHLVNDDGAGISVDSEGYTHGIIDTSWNDPNATIGTGAWMYAGGVEDTYRIEKPYSGYWGKDFKTPDGYSTWNANISEIIFKVYSSEDDAISALTAGDVDYIAWSIQPDNVNLLKQYPAIRLHYMADNGYFFLAFNEKQEPANYIAFRHAVSHVIDKQTAVEKYLGGFGRAGDSVEPPFFTSWYNASVQHYPYNLATAKKILNGQLVQADNGFVEQDPSWNEKFVDVNGDGWRDLPDGSPMQPITLLTPPADYDPVRIKVGQGIAQNLRSLGVNVQAEPVDFDTLVAYMQSYNYVILELGWSLGTDAIGNLADIFGPQSIQNTWGWWNASNPNPYYKNAGGVQNTRADTMSQNYATLFNKAIYKAATTFDTNTQIKYTKWAQNIIAQATVVNVLYYRLNIEATSNTWNGWIEWQGTVFNRFSLASLYFVGNTNSNGKLNIMPDIPEQVAVGKSAAGQITIVNQYGTPLSNVNVSISSSSQVQITPKSGKTDNTGVFSFNIMALAPGTATINIEASANGLEAEYTGAIQTLGYKALHITATAKEYTLTPGGSTQITVKATDQDGVPVSGVNVTVDENLLGYGSLDKYTNTTDQNGFATFTYSAPSSNSMQYQYTDMHTLAKLVFSATKEGYNPSNTVTMNLITYNTAESWNIVRITSATNWTVNMTSLTTDIYIHTENFDGTPLPNAYVNISYSNQTYLYNAPTSTETDSNGNAKVHLTFNKDLPTKVVIIKFKIPSEYSINDFADILYWNGDVSVPLYGGHISVEPFMAGDNTTLKYTVELYNQTNQHPIGNQTIGTILSDSPEGPLANLASGPYLDTAWEYTGINAYANYSDTTLGLMGEWNGIADNTETTVNWLDWGVNATALWGVPNQETTAYYLSFEYGINMKPMYIVNGTGTFTLARDQSSYRDLTENLYIITGGHTYYITDPSVDSFVMYGNQSFQTQIGFQRAQHILIESISTQPAVISGNNFSVNVSVYNENNAPVEGVNVKVFNNHHLFNSVSGTTDSSGRVTLTAKAPAVNTPKTIDVFARASGNTTTYRVLESTQILVEPKIAYFEYLNTPGTVLWNGTSTTITGKLMGSNGPISNTNVTLIINGTAVANNETNSNGVVSFTIKDSEYNGFVELQLRFSAYGYFTATITKEVLITGGMIGITALNYPHLVGVDEEGNITIKINSTFSLNYVTLYIKEDNESAYHKYTMQRVGNTNTYYANIKFTNAGNYSFYIVADDIHGNVVKSDTETITASSTVPELSSFGLLAITLIGMAILLLRKRE